MFNKFGMVLVTAFCIEVASSSVARAQIAGITSFGPGPTQWTYQYADGGSPSSIPSPGVIKLTNSGTFESRAIWYNTPQAFAEFLVSFTYQAQGEAGCGGNDFGVSFVLQNNAAGLNAVAASGGGNGYGYYGITTSAAVTLQAVSNASGYFTNGSFGGGGANSITPVSLLSGHPINVSLSYNGSILTETLTDAITSDPFSTNYIVINLAAELGGGSTAYVGLTGSTSCNVGTDQYLSDFQYLPAPEPGSCIMLALGFIGMGFRRRVKSTSGLERDSTPLLPYQPSYCE